MGAVPPLPIVATVEVMATEAVDAAAGATDQVMGLGVGVLGGEVVPDPVELSAVAMESPFSALTAKLYVVEALRLFTTRPVSWAFVNQTATELEAPPTVPIQSLFQLVSPAVVTCTAKRVIAGLPFALFVRVSVEVEGEAIVGAEGTFARV